MLYDNNELHQNNMERASGGATIHIAHDMAKLPLVAGDVVVLTGLPRESLTDKINILVGEAFDVGSFEVGYYDYASGTFVAFAAVLDLALQTASKNIVVAMPTTGQVNPDNTAYTGTAGSIWNGLEATVIALKWVGATPTVGIATMITSHTYFGTKDGKYGCERVPMTPYRD